jgi:hypothetical protein
MILVIIGLSIQKINRRLRYNPNYSQAPKYQLLICWVDIPSGRVELLSIGTLLLCVIHHILSGK